MRYFTIATAGHVDHGKTSLLKALTGIDSDRLREEKERQMTTDLGFAHLSISDDVIIGFIDVPGHGKFLKNMLAGVGGIDMALLVVAADEGPMPQTVQHVAILGLLGVRRVVVALNKIDAVEKDRAEESLAATKDLLQKHNLEIAGTAMVSATKNIGIDELSHVLSKSCAERNGHAHGEEALFLPIDRAFSKAGFGTVITGTVVRGSVSVGDQVTIEPKGIKAKVRRLETFGTVVEKAGPGQRVAANLALKDNKSLNRGDVIASQLPLLANILIISLLPNPSQEFEMDRIAGQDVRVYHGTAEIPGHLRFVQRCDNGMVIAKLSLEHDVAASVCDRLILRFSNENIIGGTVLILDPPRWLTKTKLPSVAQMLGEGKFSNALAEYIQLCPHGVARFADLNRIIPQAEFSAVKETLTGNGAFKEIGDYAIEGRQYRLLSDKLLKVIVETRDSTMEALRAKTMPFVAREVFQHFIQELVDSEKVTVSGDKVAEAGQKADPGYEKRRALRTQIVQVLTNSQCIELDEVAKQLKVSTVDIKQALFELSKEKQAVIVAYEFAALFSSINKWHKAMNDIWQRKKDIAPGDFREAIGLSRKYAMAILSYFDDQQITRRLPSGRVLLRPPAP